MISTNRGGGCPLCGNNSVMPYHKDRRREYIQCLHCRLVFVPDKFLLSAEDEKSEYDLHRNSSEDQGYRRFLSKLSIPLLDILKEGAEGLDFGCGPGPTLSVMFEESGHPVEIYDPFYFDNSDVLKRKYDFITMTEVAEHLYHPHKVFRQLFSLLKSPGYFGIMTKMVLDQNAFSSWHYTHDRTHICFYSRETFAYLSEVYSARVEFFGNDVIIFSTL